MHACGHDVHPAVLLGTAKVLNEMRDKFNGEIVFVFQPAEEFIQDSGRNIFLKKKKLRHSIT